MKRLAELLDVIDGKPYGHYKRIKGSYSFGDFRLHVDHVQGDPFAHPSQLRVTVLREASGFPEEWLEDPLNRIPLGDFLTRKLAGAFLSIQGGSECSGNGGRLFMAVPGQQVLPRSTFSVGGEALHYRFRAGLPARGRSILAKAGATLLLQTLPTILNQFCFLRKDFKNELEEHIRLYRLQEELRGKMLQDGLVGFVGNGSRLPRASGVSDQPLEDTAVPFQSPESLERRYELSGGMSVAGMGIPRGVTLIVGGGFHGKSTLLQALEKGIYNHVAGDGREWVVVGEDTFKIKAENGRPVTQVDISPFINHLPQKVDTRNFSTLNASGSTSQAAGIVEAVGAGSRLLLMDEDTCATNFMIRDDKMRQLIADDEEPITPYIQRVRDLFVKEGVSSILVLGGSGEYFSQSDTVIAMKEFLPRDVTREAKAIGGDTRTGEVKKGAAKEGSTPEDGLQVKLPLPDIEEHRRLNPGSSNLGEGRIKVKRMPTQLKVGALSVDVRHLEQLVCGEQVETLGYLVLRALQSGKGSPLSALKIYVEPFNKNSFEHLEALGDGFAGVRLLDFLAVLNRCPEIPITNTRRDDA